jgi:ribosomal protein S18 acetylase RimI-like enzyme
MPDALFHIEPVRTAADLEAVAELFQAYASSLGIDLAYQDFAAELVSLPGKYAPPKGELLLARDVQGEPLGCVALRPILPEGCCEMKRLYVHPRGRGLGLGRALLNAIVAEATRIGYQEMRLDTLPTMDAAIALYRGEGFVPIPPYYDTPIEGTIFMARTLTNNLAPPPGVPPGE